MDHDQGTLPSASMAVAECPPCQIMKRQVWADDSVRDAVDGNFVAVLIDFDEPASAEVVARYGVSFTPTTVVADSAGEALHRVPGRMSRSDVLSILQQVD